MHKIGILLVPVLLIAAAFSACGGGDSKTVNIPGGGKVSVGNKVPDGFPSDFPIYGGAKVTSGYKGSQGGQEGFVVVWETGDDVQKVTDFYKEKLSSGSWTTSGEFTSNGSTSLTVTNPAAKLAGALSIGEADGKTSISVFLGDDSSADSGSGSNSGSSLTSKNKTATAESEDSGSGSSSGDATSGPEKTSTPSPLPGEVKLDKNFPTDKVPLPSGARVTSNSSFGQGTSKTYIIEFYTKDAPDKVVAYFTDEMPKHGWADSFSSNSNGDYFVTFTGASNATGGNDGLTVNASASPDTPGYTVVSMTVSVTTTGG